MFSHSVKVLIKLIIISCLFSLKVFGQIDTISDNNNFLRVDSLDLFLFLHSTISISNPATFPLYNEYSIIRHGNPIFSNYSNISNMDRVKDQLISYLNFRKQQLANYDLGLIGRMLGYSKNTAAIILAIIHLIRYKSLY
jgi:hypothetical protein